MTVNQVKLIKVNKIYRLQSKEPENYFTDYANAVPSNSYTKYYCHLPHLTLFEEYYEIPAAH